MPDYRLIHRRALRGEKVGQLTDFERGVWLAYLLISDDYGVMPFDAGELARAVWLKGKPQKAVQRAFERVRDVGLIQTWTHQGALYCYAYDWQEWQNVRHPRGTIEPCPPTEVLSTCKPKTRELFASHSRSHDDESSQDSGNVSGELRNLPCLARTGGRETLTLTANANANANAEGGAGETKKPARLAFGGKRLEVPKFLDEEFVKRLNDTPFDLTAFYLALDMRLVQTGEPWDLRWIRDQFAAETPAPERRRDVRDAGDRPFTEAERQRAERHRRSVWGGCRHEPKCENAANCIAQIILGWREKEIPA